MSIFCIGCGEEKKMERLICDECVAEYEVASEQTKGQ